MEPDEMLVCKNCHTSYPVSGKVCPRCGIPLSETDERQQQDETDISQINAANFEEEIPSNAFFFVLIFIFLLVTYYL